MDKRDNRPQSPALPDRHVVDLGNVRRRIPHRLQVRYIGYSNRGSSAFAGYHPTVDFAATWNDHRDPVERFEEGMHFTATTPYAARNLPGRYVRTERTAVAASLYVAYVPDYLPELQPYLAVGRPVWDIRMTRKLTALITEIRTQALSAHLPETADRLDRLAESFIFELASLGLGTAAPDDPSEARYREVASYLEVNYRHIRNLRELLEDWGVCPRTFSRYWNRHYPQPPSRYLTELRIAEAKSLLRSTDLAVSQVAENVGFEDPLYFSRKFRKETGASPKAYRAQCQQAGESERE